MAPIGKLYTYPNNPRAFKALIAAKYNGVELEIPAFTMGETNKSAAFLAKFPFGKVPAFETAEGGAIYESNAIQYYIAASKKDTELLGKTPLEQALVQTFVNIAINEVTPAASTWIFPIFGMVPYNKQNEDKAKADLTRVFAALDKVLADKTYFVGETVTLADINIALSLLNLFKLVLDPETRKPYANLTRWFTNIVSQPNFVAVLGETVLATKQVVYQSGQPLAIPQVGAAATASPKKEEKKEKKTKETAAAAAGEEGQDL